MCMNGVSNCSNCSMRIQCETLRNTRTIIAMLEQQTNANSSLVGVIVDLANKITELETKINNISQPVPSLIIKKDEDHKEVINSNELEVITIPKKDITILDTKGNPVKKSFKQKISEVFE